MTCPHCSEAVPDHVRLCVVCGADVGCPNVRAASRTEETVALQDRVKAVEQDAVLRGSELVIQDFRQALGDSVAVICRKLGVISELASSDNVLFTTYYQGVNSESRLPENNEYDSIRQAVDGLLFPYYYDHIRFAALSLDGRGVTGYGDFCVTLKDAAIQARATVFEENTILFVQKHKIVAGDVVPRGYRAVWQDRGLLAVAKLGHLIGPTTDSAEYAHILKKNSSATVGDFIEVNIYGPINRRAIELFVGSRPRHKADRVLLDSIIDKFAEIGITSEVY